jgi:hypothetical protein
MRMLVQDLLGLLMGTSFAGGATAMSAPVAIPPTAAKVVLSVLSWTAGRSQYGAVDLVVPAAWCPPLTSYCQQSGIANSTALIKDQLLHTSPSPTPTPAAAAAAIAWSAECRQRCQAGVINSRTHGNTESL